LPQSRARLALACLFLFVLAQGLYASWLNVSFYRTYGPFFDSMSYMNGMAEIISTARHEGVPAALRRSFQSGTVSLPWVMTSLAGPWLPYSRLIGTWMQEIWMLALGVSVFTYLHRYRGIPPWVALGYTLPTLSFLGVYRFNGGISDFRMDLLLYLSLALMTVWYLATYETDSRVPWVLSAASLTLAMMNRATSPVYMAAMFGPVLLARWAFSPGRRWQLFRRAGVAWGAGFLIGALAIKQNWKFIHYYYLIWGADPNAHLPLRQGAEHLRLAFRSAGSPLVLAALLVLALTLFARRREASVAEMALLVDWKILYLGFAPALMLVGIGAGLNFLVSMPSVFGWLLFCLVPFRGEVPSSRATPFAAALLAAVSFGMAGAGLYLHLGNAGGKEATMAALKRGIALIRQDARLAGKAEAQFLTAHIVDFQASALRNVLVFEFGATPRRGVFTLPDGLRLRADLEGQFFAAVPMNWENDVPGRTDEEKIRRLVEVANRRVDYFFLPDEASIDWMEKFRANNFINTKMRVLKARLLASGRWQPIGEPLVATAHETVVLYARRDP
jgi:hypothetical protein